MLSKDSQITAKVKRAGQRIAAVVNHLDFAWVLQVIDKDDTHAFALPGVKVASRCRDRLPKQGGMFTFFPSGHSIAARRHNEEALMDPTVLLAVALQDEENPTAHALVARDVAATLTRGSSQPLHVVSVYAYPQDRWRGFPGASSPEFTSAWGQQTDETMQQKMAAYIAPLQAEGLRIISHLRVGEPHEVILQVAQDIEAGLLVMGIHSA